MTKPPPAPPPEQLDTDEANEALETLDPDDELATRPHQKLDPASGLFERPGTDADFDEKTPPPRFLQRPGNELDQTLPRDRHLADDDDDDDNA